MLINLIFISISKINSLAIRNMNMLFTRKIYFLLVLVFLLDDVYAQTAASGLSAGVTFVDIQRALSPKVSDILARKEDTLKKQFEEKGLKWPAKFIYIRSFKYDSQLELWVKQTPQEKYKLFKSYKVCALAGTLATLVSSSGSALRS